MNCAENELDERKDIGIQKSKIGIYFLIFFGGCLFYVIRMKLQTVSTSLRSTFCWEGQQYGFYNLTFFQKSMNYLNV